MDLRSISKAIAGAAVTGMASLGTSFIVIPPDVSMPWYGYVAVGVINAALGFAIVYFAPRNVPNN